MNIFIIAAFLLWRNSLFLMAWLGEKLLTFSPRFPYSDVYLIPSGLSSWIWSFANFDGVHYLTIAKHGYSAQFTQVFFPLYPMLLSVTGRITTMLNPIVVGLLISNGFFLLSLFMFVKLLSFDYKKDTIKWILLFAIFFPTSFFFGSIYTESFFFFLIIASFYSARKKKWFLAAIFGAFASVTRLIGVFLLPALLLEWYKETKKSFLHSPLLLIPLGLLSYMLYLQIKFGDLLYFWHAQPVFGAERTGTGIIILPQVVWRYFKILLNLSPTTEMYWIALLELVCTLLSLVLLYFAYRKKVRTSYLLFAFLSIITPTLTGTFSSMPRYVLMAFPIFILLGMIKSRLIKSMILTIFLVLLFILTILFTRGHWVS